MPELRKPIVGTPKEKSFVLWTVHQTASYLVGEYFNAGYYSECLKMAKAVGPMHRPTLTVVHAKRQSSLNLEAMISNLEDVSRWAGQMQSEDFHTINSHVLLTLWAAQEAGIENLVAAIMKTSLSFPRNFVFQE